MSKKKGSGWSDDEEKEEVKRSYEPSKHASDPVIRNKGFSSKKDSTAF
jgi:hypothetical protein